MPIIVKFLITLASLMALDSLRLGVIAKKIYDKGLAPYLGNKVHLWLGIVVWIIMVVGIVVFVGPKIMDKPWWQALLYGALYGLILYLMYNGTNAAFFAKWPWQVFLADCLWGMFACAVTSLVWWALNR